ncbi:hypothetical protein PUNSTDRAFT_41012 [Punctularia strigosozonata HHB-11173 SS5]|uniref:uncharacterized protein n=1 Tax=Punctularia strigosozonata (strain HHB-11173) TaxID=741275 RepID=UPI00044175EC|nr:uncharacterized protein PUNSTDRAFT_41012 [Punctularia strigosozonata HHB-11173 SS5]EIN13411.1 hypothetical protein PUNSTDRAFT_41012 [Punctularia strigosozonata HHB-11173 SS5]
MPKVKYYAVRQGREGPKIYLSWDEVTFASFICWANVSFTLALTSSAVQSGYRPTEAVASSITHPSGSHSGLSTETPNIVLSDDQKKVLRLVEQGESVFFTGSAGTGKSVLLREIIRVRGGVSSSALAVTASTGIAAVNIGGTTLHSWAGVGLGQESVERLAGKIRYQPLLEKVLKRWQNVETLVIDETFFDKLEELARILRGNDQPFGGIQVRGIQHCTQPVRTPSHADFVDMLNAMRFGRLEPPTIAAFKKLSRTVKYDDGIEPTELYPTRREVDSANQTRLRQLPGDPRQYKALDVPGYDDNGNRLPIDKTKKLLERLVAPEEITLKNLEQGVLVNGSVGKVIAFGHPPPPPPSPPASPPDSEPQGEQPPQVPAPSNQGPAWPVVQFINGITKMCHPEDFTVNNAHGEAEATRTQVPLILAWALSMHKSQGQTLERVKVNLSRTFEKGQGQYLLHRDSTSGLTTNTAHNSYVSYIIQPGEQTSVIHTSTTFVRVRAHPRVLEWYEQQQDHHDGQEFEDEMDSEEAMAAFYEDD